MDVDIPGCRIITYDHQKKAYVWGFKNTKLNSAPFKAEEVKLYILEHMKQFHGKAIAQLRWMGYCGVALFQSNIGVGEIESKFSCDYVSKISSSLSSLSAAVGLKTYNFSGNHLTTHQSQDGVVNDFLMQLNEFNRFKKNQAREKKLVKKYHLHASVDEIPKLETYEEEVREKMHSTQNLLQRIEAYENRPTFFFFDNPSPHTRSDFLKERS